MNDEEGKKKHFGKSVNGHISEVTLHTLNTCGQQKNISQCICLLGGS